MSETLGTTDRLRRHLVGSVSEDERQELERAVIEDDELFERLEAAENDLIDQYVRGELDEESARRIAALVESSPRLRAKEETTLALELTQPTVKAPGDRRAGWSAAMMTALVLGSVLALVGWLLIQTADLKASAAALATENQALEERIEALEKTLSRLDASNRSLARRLARFESEDR